MFNLLTIHINSRVKRYVHTRRQYRTKHRTHSSPKCTASTNADTTKLNNGRWREIKTMTQLYALLYAGIF